MDKKAVTRIIIVLVALILTGAALIGTWYVQSSGFIKIEYHLQEANVDGEIKSYSDMREEIEEFGGDTRGIDIHTNTFYIMLIALIFAILAFISAILVGIGKLKPKVAGIMSLSAFILTLIAPLYYFLGMTSIMLSAGIFFWGSMGGVWCGPGYSWYLMIIAMILFSITAAKFLKIKKTRFAGAGGVLTIVGACFCVISGIYYLLFLDPISIVIGIVCLISFALGITGGKSALKRKTFRVAIIGSVFVILGGCLSFVPCFIIGILFGSEPIILGILGLIFITISRKEFLEK